MKKISLCLKSVFAIFMLSFVCLIPVACSCNEMSGAKVHDNYVEFINKENNIFKFDEKGNVFLDINYEEDIEKALNAEREAYLNPEDSNFAMYPYSDFYIIKSIYEPMLEKSISQIGTNYTILKTQADQLNREKCNLINENLKAVDASTERFKTMLNTLNANEYEFKIQDESYPYRNPESNIYIELRDFKKVYENLIHDCFVLNNNFMDLYMDTLPNYSFSNIKLEEFMNSEINQGILPVVDKYLNYMVSMLSYVSFMIDGNSCSFIRSNEAFYKLYAEKLDDAFASRYIYNEHHSKIADINLFDLTNDVKPMKEEYLDYMISCQNRFFTFKQQIKYFEQAVKFVNYKDYVVYCETHESAKNNYLEYANTLDIENKNHFITVREFLDNYFTPLTQSLKALQLARIQ